MCHHLDDLSTYYVALRLTRPPYAICRQITQNRIGIFLNMLINLLEHAGFQIIKQ